MSKAKSTKEIIGCSMEEKILACATELFLDKGFARTSTIEIARRAGCNQALVHYYFRSKELLFQRIFEQKITLLITEFFTIDRAGGTFDERLKRKIEAHFEMLRSNPKIPILVFNEIATNPERIQSLRKTIGHLPQGIYNNIEQQIQEEVARGTIRPISAQDLIINIISINVGSFIILPILQHALNLSDETISTFFEQRKQECVDTILRSIRP